MSQQKLFYVTGIEQGRKVYYSGWWHTYAQPLFVNYPDIAAKKMTRSNANRVRRRLEDKAVWGGKWELEECPQ